MKSENWHRKISWFHVVAPSSAVPATLEPVAPLVGCDGNNGSKCSLDLGIFFRCSRCPSAKILIHSHPSVGYYTVPTLVAFIHDSGIGVSKHFRKQRGRDASHLKP